MSPQIKAPKVPNGERKGGRIEGQGVSPLPSRLGACGKVVSSPTEVRSGAQPGNNAFWRILKATECTFLYLFANGLSSSNSVWGNAVWGIVSCHIWGGSKVKVWGQLPREPMQNCARSLNTSIDNNTSYKYKCLVCILTSVYFLIDTDHTFSQQCVGG